MIVIGHRGAPGLEPENTVRSVRKAIACGADWVEIDVYSVADRLVVIHDDRLERTTNGIGLVVDQSVSYLRSLDAGRGERIPFLEEILDAAGQEVGVNIELKGRQTAGPVIDLLRQRVKNGICSYDQFLISSFSPWELIRCRMLSKTIRLGALYAHKPWFGFGFARLIRAFSMNVSLREVTETLVQSAHARGLAVLVYTVNTEDEVRYVVSTGADGLFTDYPERVVSSLAAYRS